MFKGYFGGLALLKYLNYVSTCIYLFPSSKMYGNYKYKSLTDRRNKTQRCHSRQRTVDFSTLPSQFNSVTNFVLSKRILESPALDKTGFLEYVISLTR
ncbi:hypothetical protein VN97_g903 [Penicillium thymicola]|uniref:Uncharacterized protein n=1 Tax=Penicillium thymicola TaxID=293382 RepID=A0AAI9XD55_PENTH|nr:hypothetical protein VN97_g903 [Penicillium thymicola]